MIVSLTKKILILIFLFSISACTDTDGFKKTGIYLGDDRIDKRSFEDEEIVNVLLDIIGTGSDPDDNLDEYLKSLEQDELGRELQSFILSLEDENFDSPGNLPREALKRRLSSIGGFYAVLGLKAFVECVVIRGNRLKPGDQRLFGKIVDYAYNEHTSGGHIDLNANHALTCGGVEILDERYSIHVSITPYDNRQQQIGLMKYKKENGRFPVLDGFLPNDPAVLYNIRNMNYKLHAKGESVQVVAAFKDEKLLPKKNPIYQQDASSCIDIFFENEPDAFKLPPQHEYCMGRCSKPPLINTGGD